MIKGFLIAASIVAAWISGVVMGDDESTPRQLKGAAVFFLIAILCGVAAWSL